VGAGGGGGVGVTSVTNKVIPARVYGTLDTFRNYRRVTGRAHGVNQLSPFPPVSCRQFARLFSTFPENTAPNIGLRNRIENVIVFKNEPFRFGATYDVP